LGQSVGAADKECVRRSKRWKNEAQLHAAASLVEEKDDAGEGIGPAQAI